MPDMTMSGMQCLVTKTIIDTINTEGLLAGCARWMDRARLSLSGEFNTSPTTISALACPFLVWFPRALHAACM